jgi:predicted Zn-dependent protease
LAHVIASHSRSKNGVASLAYGEAIQSARSAPTKKARQSRRAQLIFARLPARRWIASLRSQLDLHDRSMAFYRQSSVAPD